MMNLYLPLYSDWSDKRISLKHNWFDRLADVVRDFPVGGELPASIKHWPKKYLHLIDWIGSAEAALSPNQLLDLPVFESWPEDFRQAYKDFLHQQFLKSALGVPRIVADCFEELQQLNSELTPMLEKDGPVLHAARRLRIAQMFDHVAKRLRDLPETIQWPQAKIDDLPLVFVIDDLLGRSATRKNGQSALSRQAEAEICELRRSFCERFHLVDSEAEEEQEQLNRPIARAYFSSGQRFDAKRGFVNDLNVVGKDILETNDHSPAPLPWALVIADVLFNTGMPEDNGRGTGESQFGIAEVVPWLKTKYPQLPIVALTTEAGHSLIEKVHDLGVDYLHRTESSYVDMLIRLARGKRAAGAQLRRSMNIPEDFVAEDPRMIDVLIEAWNIAQDDAGRTVLITGEPGTGKERLAKFIHDVSPRADQTLKFVNCAQYSKDLADSELFGFYASAFTGAPNVDTNGIFHQADKGTLVLDEFADLDKDVQVKLLRTLEPKRARARPVEPRGNRRPNSRLPTSVDVRVICCTNRPISYVRKDLRTRVSKIIEIPPLRERPADIVALARHFLASEDRINAPGLSLDNEACEFLRTSDLPGNARTLEQLLDFAAMGKGKRNIIRREDLEKASSVFDDSSDDQSDQVALEASQYPAARASSSSQSSPNGELLSKAIARIVSTAGQGQEWLQLSKADTDELDEALQGSITQVIAILIEWSLFRATDAPAVASYMTGQKTKGRTPEDFLRRLLKLDPRIVEVISSSPYPPANARLKEIIDSCGRKRADQNKDNAD
ncbi:MAG TPA: sigma 54-interacting transcriptional regulator [Pyrinomonadaceae bacterium]|nr:sigma 54-interacting transcriptional regulator [Pyrinomonadaceae bacterium]